MSISLQLVELPKNEQVISRQISLPDTGGTIGRSFDCTIQLPDFDRTLSRVHAEVVVSPKGEHQLVDRSTNGVYVNGRLLGKGGKHNLSDGDSIKMGAYTLLVSDIESLFAQEDIPILEDSFEGVDVELFDVKNLEMEASSTLDSVFSQNKHAPVLDQEKKTATFSKNNVVEDDLFGYDPFEAMQDNLQMRDFNSEDDSIDDVIEFKSKHMEVSAYSETENEERRALRDSVVRLNRIVEQQNTLSSSIAHERLMSCLESTFEKFLAELNPIHLEEEFSDYLSGWGAKDKKYWSLYKKQFLRKQEKGEYYRQFYALLFEELRDKR